MWMQIFLCVLSFMMLLGKGKVSNKSSLGETYVGEKYPSLELGKKDFLRVAEGDLGNWGTVETGERYPGQKAWGGVWRKPQESCGAEPTSPRVAGPGEERFLGSLGWPHATLEAACVGKPLKTSPCVQEGKEVVGANPLRPWGTGGKEEETKHGQGPCSRERMSWVATWSSRV